MPYSSDKLYNDVIRKMMARLASDVKARELMPHLSCLTLTDKEEIEAKREIVGNYNAMLLLIENLRRRENWPEQFISALRNCEHWVLADEIQTKYDEIRGINTSAASAPVPAAASGIMPASPPAPIAAALASTQPTAGGLPKVTTATVHNVPKINPSLLIPVEEAEQSTVPVLPSSLKVAPVESHDFVSVPEAITEPEHSVKQPLSLSTTQSELSVTSVVRPSDGRTPAAPEQTSFDAPFHPAYPVTTSTSQFTTSQLPSSPESSKVPVAVMVNTSLSKHPIQDTRPPGSDIEQVSQNSLSINQHLERAETAVPSNIQTRTSFQETAWVSSAANFNSDSSLAPQDAANLEEYLSKPEVLREPQSMSISSVNLEISHVNPTVGTTVRTAMPVPVSSPQQAANYDPSLVTYESPMTSLSSRGQDFVPYLVAQEGIDLKCSGGSSNQNHKFPERLAHVLPNQPEENHYESVTAGMQGEPGTLENIVRYSEIPSRPNNSQPPSVDGIVLESLLQVQTSGNSGCTSDQSACAVKDGNVSQETKLNASGQINAPLLEEGGEHQSLLSRIPTDPRLIVAAAVGMTAIFVAWKMNH